jgi:outer membrane receptor protein involved in Fe transport
VFFLAGTAQAQVSTATIQGKVTSDGAPAPAGLPVVAVNKESGFEYKTVTLQDGSYALTGVPPGEYEIRITDPNGIAKSEPLTLFVGDTASVDLELTKREGGGEEIKVVGSRARKAVKNSEVGTNVSPILIEGLPQVSHNFLSGADLAPGVVFEQDQGSGYTNLRSGAQNHDNVNVFIDGVSQKNNILRGGMVGQDSSRGNPFPESAVKEFKVITQNYKAEFDQVSSAAITAVTKSGTNEFHGDVYFDRAETDWRNKSPLEVQNEQQGQLLLPSNKNEWGVSLGGPIVKDAVNFFFAYDGKNIGDSRQVIPRNLDKLPASNGIVPQIAGLRGSFVDSFNEHLLFGKVNAELAEDRKLSVSSTLRLESDHVPEDRILSAFGNDKNRKNSEFRIDALHEWNLGSELVSETRLDIQNAYWKPQSALNATEIRYKVSTVVPARWDNGSDVILTGGSPDNQVRGQRGFTLGQDLTYAGVARHVFKGGAKFSYLNYDLSGTSRSVDSVQTLIDTATGLSYYDSGSGNCTGTNVINNGSLSDQCKIDRALAPTSVSIDNGQIGIYGQDDWDLTDRLQINLGVRWDVETNMLNNSYVTPADRVAALNALDTRTFKGQTAAPGQTYAQSLAKGGVNIADYIADGHSRKTYLGAIAPRVGASYDLLGDKSTVVFGGYGRSYDRTMANHALDETQKNAQALPNGETWLIKNDFKMPYADQFSLGIRQAVFMLNVEAIVSELDGKNQFQWFSGNRDLNGGYFTQSIVDPLWGGPPNAGSLILGDFIGETRTRQLMFKVEKPFTKASGWTGTVAYTFSDAQTKHNDWNDDNFDWTYGRAPADRQFHPSRLLDKHRLVAAALAELPLGFVVSSKFTWGSGLPQRVVGCPYFGSNPCDFANGGARPLEAATTSFKQIDVSVSKRFGAGPGAFTLRADVLNLFDFNNYSYDQSPWGGANAAFAGKPANSVGLDNLGITTPNGLRGPTRTLKVGANYSF